MKSEPVNYNPFEHEPVEHDPFGEHETLKSTLLSVLHRHAADTRAALESHAKATQGHIDRLAKVVTAPKRVVRGADGRPMGLMTDLSRIK